MSTRAVNRPSKRVYVDLLIKGGSKEVEWDIFTIKTVKMSHWYPEMNEKWMNPKIFLTNTALSVQLTKLASPSLQKLFRYNVCAQISRLPTRKTQVCNKISLCRTGWYIMWLKGVFAKNERGYRLNAIKKRFWSLLIFYLLRLQGENCY